MARPVISAKKRSTRFSHELYRGHEVQVLAGPSGQPCLNLRMLVRGVVVHDQVNVEIGGHRRFDGAQETEKLLMC